MPEKKGCRRRRDAGEEGMPEKKGCRRRRDNE
jgi:hypothetical protein